VPIAIAALGDDGASPRVPIGWLGGGLAAVALVIAAVLVYLRRRPAYAATSSVFMTSWRRRSEERRMTNLGRARRGASIRAWWRTAGPVVSYKEWRSGKEAARSLNRKIEERRRLKGE
jgi:hypothetical protein